MVLAIARNVRWCLAKIEPVDRYGPPEGEGLPPLPRAKDPLSIFTLDTSVLWLPTKAISQPGSLLNFGNSITVYLSELLKESLRKSSYTGRKACYFPLQSNIDSGQL